MESIRSVLVCAQFSKCQLIPAFKISLVTLHAAATETTIEARVKSFFGNDHIRDFMSQSGGLRLSSASCRCPVDSTERYCPVDSAERLWLAMGEASKTASNGVEVSKMTSVLMYFNSNFDFYRIVERLHYAKE